MDLEKIGYHDATRCEAKNSLLPLILLYSYKVLTDFWEKAVYLSLLFLHSKALF